jgi:hypothetical protein
MVIDEQKCTMDRLLIKPGDSIRYEYDFGDSWQHTLSLTQTGTTTLPELATCLDGAMACWACFDKTDREKGGYWLVVFEFKLSG